MCGIFAIFFFDRDRRVNQQMVVDATNSMIHRGPDDTGVFVHGNIGLGHRRLSIVDLSSGHQPMFNEDEQVITVYNGEIYNHKEIKRELELEGHIFKTGCDTEVIVHGYEQWGPECVKKFNGMFAFAVWDRSRQQLWVARDRLGIKPLYYLLDKDKFICASEIKALLNTGLIKPEINESVLDAYFSLGYVPGPETMFKNIKKLLPGHWLLLGVGYTREHEYWDFSLQQPATDSFEKTVDNFQALLSDAVKKRLMSDVPLGAFLSGGLDSSFVVSQMSSLMSEPVNTFTIAYNEEVSEHEYAKTIADQFPTNHHVFYLDADNFMSSLKTLIAFSEEPIVEPAAIPLYHISKMAREKVTVLLSGEGADEVFGGYALYRYMAQIEKVRNFLPQSFLSALKGLAKRYSRMKYLKYLDWIDSPLKQRYQGTSSYLTPSQKDLLYTLDFQRTKSNYLESFFENLFRRVEKMDILSQMLYVDTKTWLVDDLLVKADKMTMANAVELRVPFLDHRVVEAALNIPADYKINQGEGKHILKTIAQKTLPHDIVYRKKMGFPVPTKSWFNVGLDEKIRNVISGLKEDGLLNTKQLEKLFVNHQQGVEDHSKLLMSLLVFAEWQKQFIRR